MKALEPAGAGAAKSYGVRSGTKKRMHCNTAKNTHKNFLFILIIKHSGLSFWKTHLAFSYSTTFRQMSFLSGPPVKHKFLFRFHRLNLELFPFHFPTPICINPDAPQMWVYLSSLHFPFYWQWYYTSHVWVYAHQQAVSLSHFIMVGNVTQKIDRYLRQN